MGGLAGTHADGRAAGGLPARHAGRGLRGAGRARGESAGLALAGYKIGATNAQVQARFGVDAPFSGRLFADHVGGSPLTVPANTVNFYAIEAEFDFVMGQRARPARRALHAGRRAGGGRQRAPRHRGAGFPLRRLALHEGAGPDRRQRHRLHALPRAGRRRAGSTTTSRASR